MSKKKVPSILHCPYCGSAGQKQPVIVPMKSSYDPLIARAGPDGPDYGDQVGHSRYVYACERCKFAEIWTRQPYETIEVIDP